MVRKEIKHLVIDFEPISDRISKLRIRGIYRKISLVNVHAPTEAIVEEKKDMFYEELARIMNGIPKYDIKIIIGDLNAKIGNEEIYKSITGGHSKHTESNENGKKLIEFATEMKMKIMNTCFQRKNIYKATWVSPYGNTCNQIDHVMTERKDANAIKNVRSQRGAEGGSDHYMVKVIVKQVMPQETKNKKRKIERYEVQKLQRENVRQSFIETVGRNLNNENGTKTIEEKWNRLEKTVEMSSKHILTKNKYAKNKDWFDEECRYALELKNKARNQFIQNSNEQNKILYENKKKIFKTICRNKKREKTEEMLNRVEENYKNKAIRNFYQDVKKQKDGFQNKTIYCRDKEGQLLTGENKVNRWKQYFEELLNENKKDEQTVNIREMDLVMDIRYEELIKTPDIEEIGKIIKELKNNKSPGENGLAAEVYKYGGEQLQTQIYTLVKEVWDLEQMPGRWRESVICPIHKKGD